MRAVSQISGMLGTRVPGLLTDSSLTSHDDSLRPAIRIQFTVNACHVIANGLGCDDQALGYLRVAETFGDQSQNFPFARRERSERRL
jgi:hypothetical protein